jgi:hypothetical protein
LGKTNARAAFDVGLTDNGLRKDVQPPQSSDSAARLLADRRANRVKFLERASRNHKAEPESMAA